MFGRFAPDVLKEKERASRPNPTQIMYAASKGLRQMSMDLNSTRLIEVVSNIILDRNDLKPDDLREASRRMDRRADELERS